MTKIIYLKFYNKFFSQITQKRISQILKNSKIQKKFIVAYYLKPHNYWKKV